MAEYQHPAVSQAVVIGVPDPLAGENIKAFVVLKDEFRGKIKAEETISWVRESWLPINFRGPSSFDRRSPKAREAKSCTGSCGMKS